MSVWLAGRESAIVEEEVLVFGAAAAGYLLERARRSSRSNI